MSSFTHEIVCSVSANRMFKASMIDWHNLAPKVVPEIIVSATASGDATVGSLRETKFTSAMPFGYTKERLDFIDSENLVCKGTLIEGGKIGKTLESASMHFKIEASGNGCVVKVTGTYKLLPGAIEVEEIAEVKGAMTNNFKAIEAYLVANPTAYA